MNKDDLDLYLSLKGFVTEHAFKGLSGKRRWRFDYALPDKKLAVEYHGIGPGHQSIKGSWDDQEKASEASICGWTLIICNAGSVKDGRCVGWIDRVLEDGGDG